METKRSNNNAGLHPPNHKRWTSGSSQDLWALPWWTNWQTSETIRLVDRTPTTRTTTQEAQQKLEPRMKVRANTVDNDSRCVHLVLLMKSEVLMDLWEWTIALFYFLRRTIGPFWSWHLSGCGCKHEWWTVPILDHNFSYCGALLSFWRPSSKFLPEQSSLFTERMQL